MRKARTWSFRPALLLMIGALSSPALPACGGDGEQANQTTTGGRATGVGGAAGTGGAASPASAGTVSTGGATAGGSAHTGGTTAGGSGNAAGATGNLGGSNPSGGASAGGSAAGGATTAGGSTAGGAGRPVKVTEEMWQGVGTYKVEMAMGTVYFEKDNGVSGFKGFLDSEGKDWVASYYGPGPNNDFRGFPNSTDNFGHAGRNSGSTTIVVGGKTEGDHVVLESTNGKFTFQYWFFHDHVSVKVLKSEGEYQMQLEGVIGGTADAEDYFVTGDGMKHIPKSEFEDFSPEWIYLGDPTAKDVMFMAKTPEDTGPNINRRQIREGNLHNMDLYSFSGLTGNDHVVIIGYAPASKTHEEMKTMIEGFLANPF